uniref:DUF6534 domain-containing protein n=1 Tax=Mycena chlorophos TaxID=658473 RepID=A0ABQ0LMZ3_MYCCL|nr:predicted protein [Mycena chlorophos]
MLGGGPLLVGSWASSLLYAAELSQAIHYFHHYPKDDWRLKALVATGLTVDSVALINAYISVYSYTVVYVGDAAYFQNQNWTIPVYVFTTTVIAVLVQSFLVVRYWRFAHKHLITIFLVLLILVGCGASFACGSEVALYPSFKDRGRVKIPAILWLTTEATADVCISAALLCELLRIKDAMRRTRGTLNRLINTTIRTGLATATLAVAALLAYLLSEETNVCVGIAWCLGRIYMLSMFANLNIRTPSRSHSPSDTRVPSHLTMPTDVAFASRYGEPADLVLNGLSANSQQAMSLPSRSETRDTTTDSDTLHYKPAETMDVDMDMDSRRETLPSDSVQDPQPTLERLTFIEQLEGSRASFMASAVSLLEQERRRQDQDASKLKLLRRENAELKAANASLQSEKLDLQQSVGDSEAAKLLVMGERDAALVALELCKGELAHAAELRKLDAQRVENSEQELASLQKSISGVFSAVQHTATLVVNNSSPDRENSLGNTSELLEAARSLSRPGTPFQRGLASSSSYQLPASPYPQGTAHGSSRRMQRPEAADGSLSPRVPTQGRRRSGTERTCSICKNVGCPGSRRRANCPMKLEAGPSAQ